MTAKKKNFTLVERNLLIEILKSFKNIIENKKTDAASTSAKKTSWAKIAEKYNSSSLINEPASTEQLRRLWQNLKTRQRDALTRERQYRMATGGGGPCPDADIDPSICEITPALLVEIPETIDSDTHVTPVAPPTSDDITLEASTSYATPAGASTSNDTMVGASTSYMTLDNIIEESEVQVSQTTQEADEEPVFSTNEKRLRTQILKREHLKREQRAEELHSLTTKHLLEKHQLELQILQENLREARAKANKAEKESNSTLPHQARHPGVAKWTA